MNNPYKQLLSCLNDLPVKRLRKQMLVDGNGEVCALGACLPKYEYSHYVEVHNGRGHSKDNEQYFYALVKQRLNKGVPKEFQLFVTDVFQINDAFSGSPEERWLYMHEWAKRAALLFDDMVQIATDSFRSIAETGTDMVMWPKSPDTEKGC